MLRIISSVWSPLLRLSIEISVRFLSEAAVLLCFVRLFEVVFRVFAKENAFVRLLWDDCFVFCSFSFALDC